MMKDFVFSFIILVCPKCGETFMVNCIISLNYYDCCFGLCPFMDWRSRYLFLQGPLVKEVFFHLYPMTQTYVGKKLKNKDIQNITYDYCNTPSSVIFRQLTYCVG